MAQPAGKVGSMNALWLTLRKIGQVCRHEFTAVLKRRSAQAVIFALPLVSLLGILLLNLLARPQLPDDVDLAFLSEGLALDGINPADLVSDFVFEASGPVRPVGVVDLSGQLQTYPPFPEDAALVAYDEQSAAYHAFRQRAIHGYYVIPASFPDLADGEAITLYAGRIGLSSTYQQSLYQLLLVNFIADADTRQRLLAPTASLSLVDLTQPDRTRTSAAHYMSDVTLVFAVSLLFYLTVMGAAGYLLQGLSEEKNNRILEILLSSLRPIELLLGKLLGLGAIGLVQIAIWSLVSLTLFASQLDFAFLGLPDLTPLTGVLIVAYFLVGYLVYGSIYAGVGAVVPSPKESSQYTLLVALPVFIPLMLLGAITGAPNSRVALVLSLFPLTAPLAMPMRLVVTAVPTLQWLLSLGLSLATAVVALWIATRLFRSQTLLSGQS
jgi:ABC-2 type transport system permease protein